MRRILLALLIVVSPIATTVLVYLNVASNIPTSPEAVGLVGTIEGAAYPGVEDSSVSSTILNDPFGIAVDRRGAVADSVA
jgi:hypothetical protein